MANGTFKRRTKENFLRLFGKKKSHKGWIWSSLIGLGVSALAYGVGKNRSDNVAQPLQKMMSNFRLGGNNQNLAELMEISNEIVPYDSQNNNK